MKSLKIQLSAIFMMSIFTIMSAQVTLGVKTGVNIADAQVGGLNTNLIPEINTNSGFSTGIWAEIPMLNGFSFRPELNYTQKGFRTFGDLGFFGVNVNNLPAGLGFRVRLNTVDVPLLFKYSYGNDAAKVYAILGPNVSYSTDAYARPVVQALLSFNLGDQNINLSNDLYRRWELSGTIGIGGEVKAGNGKIFGDVRFNHGVSNLLNDPIIDIEIRNKSFGVHVGYGYTF